VALPVFEYKGKSVSGTVVQGNLRAKSRADLERMLRANRILVSSVSRKPSDLNIRIGTGIKKIHVSRFTRQFATMIGAGLPMVQCLDILAQQMEAPEMRKIVGEIKESVQSGTTLSEAMRKHKKVFDDLYVNMVEAGEVGGALDTILVRLANYREKADQLARKVKGALVYPVVVSIVAIGVTIAMLKFIVPVFAKMFSDLGAELPEPTLIILGLSDFINDYFWVMILGALTIVTAVKLYGKTSKGRLNLDRIKLMLPAVGTLIRKSSVARFSRTLGTLISSGVSILDALDTTARTAGNRVVHDAIKKATVAIAEGDTITGPLKDSGVFPPMVIQMISVGEKTGGLDDMLNKIADFYDEEVDAAVTALTSMIEPAVIVVMGAVIGGILISMYLPMFDIIGKIN
jgi:type IV pilus assembly protein PilC